MPTAKRIGILCVHGIGDQQRSQHVDVVARQFLRHLQSAYGAEHVFVDCPGLKTASITPDVSFAVTTGNEIIVFDLVEVWWRDLGERPGLKHLLRFWGWALTLWTTSGFAAQPSIGRTLPSRSENSRVRRFSVSFVERARLFFQSLAFFVLLLPLQLVLSLFAMFPFVRRIDLLHVVYAYLSSVKIYQQQVSDTKQHVLDHVLSRRVRIQKRSATMFVAMAEARFDRWYVLAHSLGSIIAFKTLMFDGEAFARSLTKGQWDALNPDWKVEGQTEPRDFVDKPPKPWWLRESDAVDVSAVFEGMKGFVTYGSPIETFAALWPSIIETNTALDHIQADWINLYDRRDFISSPIRCMAGINQALPVVNLEIDSHWLIAKSHTNYLTAKRSTAAVIRDLVQWMAGEKTLDDLRNGPAKQHHPVKIAATVALQTGVILTAGAIIFPIALYVMWSGATGIIRLVDRLVKSRTLSPEIASALDWVTAALESMVIHFEDGILVFSGIPKSLALVGGTLLIFGAAKTAFISLKRTPRRSSP